MKNNNSMRPLFIGHGSPMNIISDNPYTQAQARIGRELGSPSAILCISAHWQTRGTQVLSSERPQQIFDFYGFPEPLYKVRYEPPGAPVWAEEIHKMNLNKFSLSDSWGLDHGTWAILKFMVPQQNIPVFQMSLNRNLKPIEHFHLAKELTPWRRRGLQVIGSGNLVHNLHDIKWDEFATPYDWALEFEREAVQILQDGDLTGEEKVKRIFASKLISVAHPTVDHLLPLVYALALSDQDQAEVLMTGVQNASVSMAALRL